MHQPGPWKLCYDGQIDAADGSFVCSFRWDTVKEFNEGKNAATARLIKAAPDLLAFAESIVTLFGEAYPKAGLHRDMDKDSLLNAAQEVIAKAKLG